MNKIDFLFIINKCILHHNILKNTIDLTLLNIKRSNLKQFLELNNILLFLIPFYICQNSMYIISIYIYS